MTWVAKEILKMFDDGHTELVNIEIRDGALVVAHDVEPTKASLIVAAPDLLAAAKRAINVLKAQGESTRSGNVLGALAAAIAKAETP